MMMKSHLLRLSLVVFCGLLSGCFEATQARPNHAISVIANPEKGGKLVAVPKPCPAWNKDPLDGLDNQFADNFGCADMYNLGKMIAEPKDLLHGQPLGEADAASGVLGIERYRSDKKKELINPKEIGATGK
ncbi:MAG: CpaD family pilus assembly lipoprotein [Alphaproteobacteria bacterium]|nr:CpaD family pilus assembly lipoprotein [Alphaproteobacteria bacterium]